MCTQLYDCAECNSLLSRVIDDNMLAFVAPSSSDVFIVALALLGELEHLFYLLM